MINSFVALSHTRPSNTLQPIHRHGGSSPWLLSPVPVVTRPVSGIDPTAVIRREGPVPRMVLVHAWRGALLSVRRRLGPVYSGSVSMANASHGPSVPVVFRFPTGSSVLAMRIVPSGIVSSSPTGAACVGERLMTVRMVRGFW